MEHLVKLKGLYTYPSEVSEVPEGALKVARDIVIDRDSVAEARPGFKGYSTLSGDTNDRGKSLMIYKNTLLEHYGSTLQYDNAGTPVPYSGTFDPPSHGDSYIPKIRGAEMNSNFYFTSNTGIQKLSALAGSVSKAGIAAGLDINLTLLAASSGFMSDNTQVAYRQVWGIRDANNNLILGAPSQRTIIANSSGSSKNVTVNFSIPDGITTANFFQVYRSGLSVSSSTDPSDDQQLVYEANPSSTDISNKYISFDDSTPDSLRGAALYTNASQEGISQANAQPPSAKDVAVFKNMMFYANTLHKQNRTITLLASGGASGVSYASFTGTTTNGSASVTSVSSVVGLHVGQTITGTGIPAATTITVVGTTTITLSANATASNVGTALVAYDTITIDGISYIANTTEDVATRKFKVFTAGTPAQNISDTSQSLCKVINRTTSNTTIYAYYLSGPSDLPGKIYLEARSLGYSTFYVTAAANGAAWNPQLPTSGTSVASSKDEFKHYLFFSKIQQPEHVPLVNFVAVGAADEPILRILPLRDSLIIMKSDGVYRLTGTSPSTLDVNILDNTVKLLAPETAVRLNNQIHAFTNQLITTITDTGVGVISRPIEDQLVPVIQYANFMTSAFAVSYETAHKYILWIPSNSTDAFSSHAFVYNTFTQAWVEWTRAATCGVVNPGDDKLYFASGTVNKILQQRKNNTYTDFADEEYTITVTAINGNQLTVDDISNVEVGDVFQQTGLPFSEVTAVDVPNSIVTLDIVRSWTLTTGTLYKHITSTVTWAAQYCKNPGVLKQIREITVLLKDRRFRSASLSFTSNIIKSSETISLTGFVSFLWGYFPWGGIPWGGANDVDKLRTWIPSTMQRCSWLNITFQHASAFGAFGVAGLILIDNQGGERTSK